MIAQKQEKKIKAMPKNKILTLSHFFYPFSFFT